MDLVDKAIERLKTASEMSLAIYGQPLIITTSGGKDSDVCLELARHSGIPYEVNHSLTTADAPQTVHHIQKRFYELEPSGIKCSISKPMYKGKRTSMWELIPQKLMPPTRRVRYCCDILKEQAGKGRFITTGVRWEESVSRKKKRGIYEALPRNIENKIIISNDNADERRIFETCKLKAKRVCNPIVDWTYRDVWDYIAAEKIPMNPLYSMGFDRVGCIGCPMAGNKRYFEFRMFPTYQENYIRSFDRMLKARKVRGLLVDQRWDSAESVFRWYMEENPDQLTWDDLIA